MEKEEEKEKKKEGKGWDGITASNQRQNEIIWQNCSLYMTPFLRVKILSPTVRAE